ncbi:MAG: hemolysin III family protein [Proteobacteria bacterium]|nr:hemolysin III family protein [Pseudomonadota bacterium]
MAAGLLLVASVHDARTRVACAVYAVFLAALFGVSATLHRADWSPRVWAWLRRADHATIFVFIAGTYTPFSLLGLGGTTGTKLLVLAWTVCGVGVLRAVAWPHAPRAITAACFVAAGWVAVAYMPELRAAIDAGSFALIIGGGALFTLGAVIYLVRWPDPSPLVFGYHEIFHLLTIVGCGAHFVAVVRLVS